MTLCHDLMSRITLCLVSPCVYPAHTEVCVTWCVRVDVHAVCVCTVCVCKVRECAQGVCVSVRCVCVCHVCVCVCVPEPCGQEEEYRQPP